MSPSPDGALLAGHALAFSATGYAATCGLLKIKPPRKTDVWTVAGMMVAAITLIGLLMLFVIYKL